MAAFLVASSLARGGIPVSRGGTRRARTRVVTRATVIHRRNRPSTTREGATSDCSSHTITTADDAEEAAPRVDDTTGGGGSSGRRAALLRSFSFSAAAAAALVSTPRPAAAAGKQPIDWLFEESVKGGSSIGSTIKDSLAESGLDVKRDEAPSGGGGASSGEGGEGGDVEVSGGNSAAATDGDGDGGGGGDFFGTAVKFGKLGVILVFADVVTFFVMGRSVLGIMDDGGEEGWKEKVADEIMARAKAKDAAAAGQDEEGEDDAMPPPASQ